MAEQAHAIEPGHPPALLMLVVNPVLGVLLRTPLGGPARKRLMVLRFSGRKTGRPFSVPVSAHLIGGQLYALTGATWKQNFRDGADALVVHDGATRAMRGELIGDRAAVAELYLRCVESYGLRRAPWMLGLKFRGPRIPSREEFADAVERLHLGAVRFTPAG